MLIISYNSFSWGGITYNNLLDLDPHARAGVFLKYIQIIKRKYLK